MKSHCRCRTCGARRKLKKHPAAIVSNLAACAAPGAGERTNIGTESSCHRCAPKKDDMQSAGNAFTIRTAEDQVTACSNLMVAGAILAITDCHSLLI
jgi:hypothetical protein